MHPTQSTSIAGSETADATAMNELVPATARHAGGRRTSKPDFIQSVKAPVGATVELRDVYRNFGSVKAVDGVSLCVEPGEFFTLLGPSGSGKTTILHIVAGFQHPDGGDVCLDGRAISGLPPFRRGIGVVFQSYALFPHLTVSENVAFPLRVRKRPRDEVATRVQQALELVQLPDHGQRRISQLSGGQQQRVALARAIVFDPRLLLMDEPLSALDAKLRKAMQAELKALQRSLGVTVIYVTHDQEEALALSDRIAVMQDGRIEQVAPPAELYERPANRFVADFLGEANLIEAEVVGYESGGGVLLQAGIQRLRAVSEERQETGKPVQLALRPERVLVNPQYPLANTMGGTVKEELYNGDHTMLSIRTAAGFDITAQYHAERGPVPKRGEKVTVGWDMDRGVVLKD